MINSNTVLPLQSMGDGINRILSIILALIHSEKGFLLIDEFENGLHHSVQEKLWEIIFELSNILDIQVFATTHSEDCIAGFESVLNMPEKGFDGRLIRLDLVDDKIQYVAYSKQEIGIAMENDIETR
jgi:AAA15 family ATPase/GTPase